MQFWDWMIIAGSGVLLLVIISIVMYALGKRKGIQLGYAEPMKRKNDEEHIRQYIETLRPFLPLRMLGSLKIIEREIPPDKLCDQRTDVTATVMCGGHPVTGSFVTEHSTDEIYDEINKTLNVVFPAIADNHGLLEVVKDGLFRVLFLEEPESALRSAILAMDILKDQSISFGLTYGLFVCRSSLCHQVPWLVRCFARKLMSTMPTSFRPENMSNRSESLTRSSIPGFWESCITRTRIRWMRYMISLTVIRWNAEIAREKQRCFFRRESACIRSAGLPSQEGILSRC